LNIEGGYLLTKHPFILSSAAAAHTTELHRPVSDADLDAINRVQATPWRINRWMFDVITEAWAKGLNVKGLPTEQPVPIPPRMDDAAWASVSEEGRKAHLDAKRKAHEKNASRTGRLQALWDRMTVAHEMVNRERLWFPHARCFRGRIYPIPTAGPHPQGDDVSKALLHFAEGMPLGPDGMFWLCVRAANCFGMDKLPLQERVSWTLDNQQEIEANAMDPFRHLQWTRANEPWGFLATCHELAEVWYSACPEEFPSHLPIPMDG
jgi:DNA-directed RNA polymerase